jgi:hypothetical protein
MKRHLLIAFLLTGLLFMSVPLAFAQQQKANPSANDANTDDNTQAPPGQEVEINEDNYRQFMELRDARLRRGILLEDAFKPGATPQKRDKWPEESQKHLRNQLREIIVRGDQWQPGDENKSYPYVPSEAARTNQSLQKQEAEAWGELVENYHKREAQIYANSARSQAAMASDKTLGGSSNTGEGSPGDGTGQPGSVEQAATQTRENAENSGGGFAPGEMRDSNANTKAGVSQNAMEFLNRMQNGNSSGDGADHGVGQQGGQAQPEPQSQAESRRAADNTMGTASDPGAQGVAGASQNAMEFLQGSGGRADETGEGGPAPSRGDGGQAEQQSLGATDDPADGQKTAEAGLMNPSQRETAQSTTGSSQNAMQYLQEAGSPQAPTDEGLADAASQDKVEGEDQGNDRGDGDDSADHEGEDETNVADLALPESISGNDRDVTSSESTAGAAQNALEYLEGNQQGTGTEQPIPSDPSNQQGTLSIQDLLNAQGVNTGSAVLPPEEANEEEPPTVENPPDKDGDS